jgi:hypothetical protein
VQLDGVEEMIAMVVVTSLAVAMVWGVFILGCFLLLLL